MQKYFRLLGFILQNDKKRFDLRIVELILFIFDLFYGEKTI